MVNATVGVPEPRPLQSKTRGRTRWPLPLRDLGGVLGLEPRRTTGGFTDREEAAAANKADGEKGDEAGAGDVAAMGMRSSTPLLEYRRWRTRTPRASSECRPRPLHWGRRAGKGGYATDKAESRTGP